MNHERRITMITQDEACRDIMRHYGIQPQKIKLMEELAELIQATAKSPVGIVSDDMVEEIADVLIMIEQMKSAISPDQVRLLHDMVSYKLRRQLTRMEGE